MNKKVFTGLVVLMGISILGIIAVQLVWMNNALKVKNELFERSVTEALNNTVENLEKTHNVGIVNDMIFNDSVLWIGNRSGNLLHQKPTKDYSFNTNRTVKIIREGMPVKGSAKFEVRIETDDSDSSNLHYEYSTFKHEEAGDSNVFILKKHPGSKEDVVIVTDTLYGSVDSLIEISLMRIDSVETDVESFNITVPDLKQRVKVKAGELKTIANKVVTEVVAWDAFEVDSVMISKELKDALSDQNIDLNFEFGVLRDSLITCVSENVDSAKLVNSHFQASLYPGNIFEKNLILSVYFPERESFIFKSLNWLLILSFLFSMIILITFSLSIFYILRQKKISEMKSDFINNMTHEFKTPIATISVAADSISNKKVVENPERIKYFVGMIKKENTRMNRQVEDILTIARLDKKEFEFKWEPINVHDLIKDAIQGISIQVEKRSGKINEDLKAENPMVTTDKFHCTNIIYNLLDNAIKYSSGAPDIKISSQNVAKGIMLKIEDHGIGMTKSVQNRIFERFYRQASGNIHNVKGFGLGLSYVKAVIEANKGKITVQSEPGKGSEFSIFLPFAREN